MQDRSDCVTAFSFELLTPPFSFKIACKAFVHSSADKFRCVDAFAGKARISKAMAEQSIPTATLDISTGPQDEPRFKSNLRRLKFCFQLSYVPGKQTALEERAKWAEKGPCVRSGSVARAGRAQCAGAWRELGSTDKRAKAHLYMSEYQTQDDRYQAGQRRQHPIEIEVDLGAALADGYVAFRTRAGAMLSAHDMPKKYLISATDTNRNAVLWHRDLHVEVKDTGDAQEWQQ